MTLLFGNVDWFTFRIKDRCAYSILAHSQNKDNTGTEFVMVKDRLHICTNFYFKDIKNNNQINESYNKFSCNLIDLDAEEENSEVHNDQLKNQLESYDVYYSRIPQDFCPG
ncbi:MAG: hypothetical protein ACKO96_35915, partial [Flammeovirgaceae bacterium]